MWGSIARLRNGKPCRRLAKPAILPTTKSKSGWNRVYLHFYGFWWYRLKITKSINWIWIMKWMLRYSGMCGFLYSEQETRAYQGSERGCKWSYLSSEDPFWINSKIWGGVSNSSTTPSTGVLGGGATKGSVSSRVLSSLHLISHVNSPSVSEMHIMCFIVSYLLMPVDSSWVRGRREVIAELPMDSEEVREWLIVTLEAESRCSLLWWVWLFVACEHRYLS